MNIVILAAGQGKRMRSDTPKVLHGVGGRALLAHVIATARALGAVQPIVVYGHGGEPVREALHRPGLVFALQDPPRGTGDAVRAALPSLPQTASEAKWRE